MQIRANLRAEGGSRRWHHGSAAMIKLQQSPWYVLRKTCSIYSGNNEKKEGGEERQKKKKQKPFRLVKNYDVHTDFLIILFR